MGEWVICLGLGLGEGWEGGWVIGLGLGEGWDIGLHRKNPTAVRHRCAQRYDSKNKHSTVTAKASTAL